MPTSGLVACLFVALPVARFGSEAEDYYLTEDVAVMEAATVARAFGDRAPAVFDRCRTSSVKFRASLVSNSIIAELS
jgi:hypothetical protein